MPLISDDNRLTIPEELIACTNLDVTKPIYLYKVRKIVHLSNHYQDCFYFSNKKKQKNCLGKIVLDKDLAFELSENLIGVLKAKKNCVMCAQTELLYYYLNIVLNMILLANSNHVIHLESVKFQMKC